MAARGSDMAVYYMLEELSQPAAQARHTQ